MSEKATPMDFEKSQKAIFDFSTPKPSAIKVDKKRPKSTPVRNPAFREHEGLKALQKQLNSRGKK
ncbi:hypothetical protein SEA_TOKKI_59 [Arthrobacter phage Tokki]|nr:hypothetical protein SEA_TOKKI_59 [Arthrobacter phage Tokki]